MALALRLRERKANEDTIHQIGHSVSSPNTEPQQLPIQINHASSPSSRSTGPNLLSHINPGDCDPQEGSIIFSIPIELRKEIYRHVFVQYESRASSYTPDALYYRPGCTGPKRINTALLYTCRQIFLEARHIPLQTATHEFWGQVHSPEQHTEPSEMIRSHRNMRGMTEAHLPYLRRFNFYGSLYNLVSSTRMHMNFLFFSDNAFQCRPQHVTVTVPYEGWDNWTYGFEPELWPDSEDELFQSNWPASIETLCIRLETLEIFAPELEEIMTRLMARGIPRKRDDECSQYLTAKTPMRVSRWTGPHTQYFKDRWESGIEHLGPDPLDVPELWYYVVEATWSVDV
ncbi:hypothetical protein N7492_001307 [Penicillium capsulatum]|uniref:Uncharacterized protein n=1 Tax=Penicillium capsulatum TaxID=69766 RepID=A0A9W9IXG9_9EURO|nr:hypothetical protein N7492_001307 [Penicillium capsulatum]KAJ6129635.1 hypothetical protein N7512_002415 [Penicillium capsulatum]